MESDGVVKPQHSFIYLVLIMVSHYR
jgi:hypothetical protein